MYEKTIEDKLELLTYPAWSTSQLMAYLGIKSRTTASKVKSKAIKDYNGYVPYGSQYVKRDAILEMLGTDVEHEKNKLTGN